MGMGVSNNENIKNEVGAIRKLINNNKQRSKTDGNRSYSPTYNRKLEAIEHEKEADTY